MSYSRSPNSEARKFEYRAEIDGLRAIAVAAVVAYHIEFPWAKGGFIGVDVFFAISGYLIGSMLYRDIQEGNFSMLKFYRRRAKRILPALFVVLAFAYLAATLLLSPHETRVFSVEALSALFSSSNIFYAWRSGGYFSPASKLSPLLMTWSLGVEEQFYILIPVLMFLLRKQSQARQFAVLGLLSILSFAASAFGARHFPAFAFFWLPTRAWELASGVLVGIAETNRPVLATTTPSVLRHGLGILGLALIGGSIIAPNHDGALAAFMGLVPVSGALMVIGTKSGIAHRLLSFQPMRSVGLVSYSWYLWHWPLLSFARIACRGELRTEAGVLIGIISFAVAVVSFRYVESPFRASTTTAPLLLKRYAVATLAMMALPIALFASQGLPQRNRIAQNLDMATASLGSDMCMVESPVSHPRLTASCVPKGEGYSIAVIGDSHAAALADALRQVAAMSNYRLIEFTKGFCTAIGAPPDKPLVGSECADFNLDFRDYIERDRSVRAVVLAGYWSLLFAPMSPCSVGQEPLARWQVSAKDKEQYAFLATQLDTLLDSIEKAGKIVYLVQDNPHFSFDPMRLMRTEVIEPRRALAGMLGDDPNSYIGGKAPECNSVEDLDARKLIFDGAARHPKVRLVDLHNALCSLSACEFALRDEILFMDNNHLSLRGAQVALQGLDFSGMGFDQFATHLQRAPLGGQESTPASSAPSRLQTTAIRAKQGE
jgi:peptidoglycan/LPS O-acetylase OafA/YrhL